MIPGLIRRIYPISELHIRAAADDGTPSRQLTAVVTRLGEYPDWFDAGALETQAGNPGDVSDWNHDSVDSVSRPVGMFEGIAERDDGGVAIDVTYDDTAEGRSAFEYLQMRKDQGRPIYWSIGFVPDAVTLSEFDTDEDNSDEPPFRTTRATLYEASPVTAPFYRDTYVETLRSLATRQVVHDFSGGILTESEFEDRLTEMVRRTQKRDDPGRSDPAIDYGEFNLMRTQQIIAGLTDAIPPAAGSR